MLSQIVLEFRAIHVDSLQMEGVISVCNIEEFFYKM